MTNSNKFVVTTTGPAKKGKASKGGAKLPPAFSTPAPNVVTAAMKNGKSVGKKSTKVAPKGGKGAGKTGKSGALLTMTQRRGNNQSSTAGFAAGAGVVVFAVLAVATVLMNRQRRSEGYTLVTSSSSGEYLVPVSEATPLVTTAIDQPALE